MMGSEWDDGAVDSGTQSVQEKDDATKKRKRSASANFHAALKQTHEVVNAERADNPKAQSDAPPKQRQCGEDSGEIGGRKKERKLIPLGR